MSSIEQTLRRLVATPASYLERPRARVQPVLAKKGPPNVDLDALSKMVEGVADIADPVAIESPEHWARVVGDLGPDVDAILPVSITAYPTEIWNSHPQPLVERELPFVFWPIIKYDEPDFWRWSARDFLTSLGIEVHLVQNCARGLALLRALGLKRMLRDARMVVFGKQNFPWNVPAAGHFVTERLGTELVVRDLDDIRRRRDAVTDEQIDEVWRARSGPYEVKSVAAEDLRVAVGTYLAVKAILEEERALGFGVNCFGELVVEGGRDVPCLAQALVREDGYIASCDGDYLAMTCMALATYFLDKTAMMSNMYPVQYVGALGDHFGDPLSPDEAAHPKASWKNLARLGHCGFVGVVSPEQSPSGKVSLCDWGGTYEIKRDGRGCGIDGDLVAGARMTALQLKFDGTTLLVGDCRCEETTRHPGMPHCESTALISFRDLEGFVRNISREHSVFVYGDHVADFGVLADVLGLKPLVF